MGGDERVRDAHRESIRVKLDEILRQRDPELKQAVELLAHGQVPSSSPPTTHPVVS